MTDPVFYLPAFQNQQLWQQAMTHSSFANEHSSDLHNERLEFLGDAILTFVSGAYLYSRFPDRPEGELTTIRAALVDRPQLCHFANKLKLGNSLQLGEGLKQRETSARLLCSAFEALIGAYFLDCDQQMQPMKDYVEPMFDQVIDQVIQQGSKDDKTQLQERLQQQGKSPPEYVDLDTRGPDHAKEFLVVVRINGKDYAQAWGPSKKSAQKRAAKATLATLTAEST